MSTAVADDARRRDGVGEGGGGERQEDDIRELLGEVLGADVAVPNRRHRDQREVHLTHTA